MESLLGCRGRIKGKEIVNYGELVSFLKKLYYDSPSGLLEEGVTVPFVPTPIEEIPLILKLFDVKVGEQKTLVDIGSGDGRVLIGVALFKIRGIGYEKRKKLVEFTRQKAEKAGVEGLIRIYKRDVLRDRLPHLSKADYVYIYMNPIVNEKIGKKLKKSRKRVVVVSRDFEIPSLRKYKEDETERFYKYSIT